MAASTTATRAAGVLATLVLAGCHVTATSTETIPGETNLRPRKPKAEKLLAPKLSVTTTGHFRLARAQMCVHDLVEDRDTYRRKSIKPNYATVVVGLIALSAGVITGLSGLSDDEPGSSPRTYLGVAGLGVGVPFAFGPFFGNRSERSFVSSSKAVRGTKDVPCGAWPLPPSRVSVKSGQRKVPTRIVKDGLLTVSPFDLVDAFALQRTPTLELEVSINSGGGATSAVRTTIDSDQLTKGRAGFFERSKIDARVEKLQRVPRVGIVEISVTRNDRAGEPVIEIRARLKNTGPGDAWGVRGEVYSHHPEINGRFLYAGHVPSKQSAHPVVVIPVSSPTLDLSEAGIRILLRDAHNTTSTEPVRFTGVVLNATREQ